MILNVLDNRIEERKARDNTLVGNLAQSLAEPFRIDDEETIKRVSLATRYFDIFTHQLDDVKDRGPGAATSAHMATSNLLCGIYEVLKDAENSEGVYQNLIRYWQEASEGERHLWRHHGKLIPYDAKDLVMLGKRGSMAKIPIALYADASKNEWPVKNLEMGVENAGLAVQLFDDIFDWKEDLEGKIYTHPIVLAYNKTGDLSPESIEQGLFYMGALKETSDIALHYFKEGRKHFSQAGATELASTINLLENSAVELNKHVDKLRKEGYVDNITKKVRRLADPLLTCH